MRVPTYQLQITWCNVISYCTYKYTHVALGMLTAPGSWLASPKPPDCPKYCQRKSWGKLSRSKYSLYSLKELRFCKPAFVLFISMLSWLAIGTSAPPPPVSNPPSRVAVQSICHILSDDHVCLCVRDTINIKPDACSLRVSIHYAYVCLTTHSRPAPQAPLRGDFSPTDNAKPSEIKRGMVGFGFDKFKPS